MSKKKEKEKELSKKSENPEDVVTPTAQDTQFGAGAVAEIEKLENRITAIENVIENIYDKISAAAEEHRDNLKEQNIVGWFSNSDSKWIRLRELLITALDLTDEIPVNKGILRLILRTYESYKIGKELDCKNLFSQIENIQKDDTRKEFRETLIDKFEQYCVARMNLKT
jgi:hypothetical protein